VKCPGIADLVNCLIKDNPLSLSDYLYTPDSYYIPYPVPDPLSEPPKLIGKQYHIAYPEPYTIGKYQCYKNEKNSYDVEGRLRTGYLIYVSPKIGIIRIETFSVNYRWNSNGITTKVEQLDLIKW
jgi:hypothetical protein